MTMTIHVEDEVWRKLNQLKKPGDTFNDVIQRLLKTKEEKEND